MTTTQRIIFWSTLLLAVSAFSHGAIGSALVAFLVAGTLPFTNITVSSWIMIPLYCLTISALITHAVEKYYKLKHRLATE